MLVFIVADIWNCYNMGMKKVANLDLRKEKIMIKLKKNIVFYLILTIEMCIRDSHYMYIQILVLE